MMDPQVKALWVEALRSGKYKQGQGFLEADGCNCCLGVLARVKNIPVKDDVDAYKLFVFEGDRQSGRAGTIPDDFCGIEYYVAERLAEMNDSQNHDFLAIADYIESNL